MEGQGKMTEAASLFLQAWNSAANDLEKFTAAHYVARHQSHPKEKLHWDQIALTHALKIPGDAILPVLPSLYLNIGKDFEDLHDPENAGKNYHLAASFTQHLSQDGYGNMIRSGIQTALQRRSPQSS
jgi:rifampin ADP-ribosylating transferase